MGIEKNETTKKRVEIEILCQQNREAFLRMDFLLGVDRPMETLSTGDILCLVRFQIEEMNQEIVELDEMLQTDGQ